MIRKIIALMIIISMLALVSCGKSSKETAQESSESVAEQFSESTSGEMEEEVSEQAEEKVEEQAEPVVVEEGAKVGEGALSFTVTDIDGNEIKSSDLFADKKFTMVNLWTTWCGYCVQEMPELAKLAKELEEKDAALVGVLCDGYEEGALDTGKEIISLTGVEYKNIMPWDTLFNDLEVIGFPATFFVDSEGNVVGGPIFGADFNAYKETIEKLLAE